MLPEGSLSFQFDRSTALIKTFECAVKLLPIVFQLVAFCESCTDARLQIQEFSYPAFFKKLCLISQRQAFKPQET
jgi:hypothetical protein